ncbi:hypothetical protein AB6O49_34445 [Streptomyces sp. SBR177]
MGGTADSVNTLADLSGRLPWALGFMAVSTFVLLLLFTSSVLIRSRPWSSRPLA